MILLVNWTGSSDLDWFSWGKMVYYSLTHMFGVPSMTTEVMGTAGVSVNMISHLSCGYSHVNVRFPSSKMGKASKCRNFFKYLFCHIF